MENALGPLTFEVGQRAIFLGRAYYGCVATVLPDVSAGLTRKVGLLLSCPHCCSYLSPKTSIHRLEPQFRQRLGLTLSTVLSQL